MESYKALNKQIFTKDTFSIVPIRLKDRFKIRAWRNEQMYHLRQNKLLTKKDQENYFDTIVAELFIQNQPNQILFSYLEEDICIGYGGLVHINWIDKNAEISFIMNTQLEQDFFKKHWCNFLYLLEQVAFDELKLHKIFTYAFDLRPHLYRALIEVFFIEEARLKEHVLFGEKYIDVVIHSKKNDRC